MFSKLNLITNRHILVKSQHLISLNWKYTEPVQNVQSSYYHVASNKRRGFPESSLQHRTLLNLSSVRALSGTGVHSAAATTNASLVDDVSTTVVDTIQQAPDVASVAAAAVTGEAPLSTYGLGGWWPTGIVENYLEFLHFSFDLPWWITIAVATASIRLLTFPIYIYTQQNMARLQNNTPGMQALQAKIKEAQLAGDALSVRRYNLELIVFMREKNFSPFKNFLMPLCQGPIFISFFFAIRDMVRIPVESLQTGGALWFTDLTVVDPTFLLPAIMSATLAITIETSLNRVDVMKPEGKITKWVMRAVPLISFPFTMNFETAILCYWTCTNFVTMLLTGFFQINAVRDFFGVDRLIDHGANRKKEEEQAVKPRKDSFANIRKGVRRSYEHERKSN